MPDSGDLPRAFGDALDQGRQFLARIESIGGTVSAELARHEQAARESAGERDGLRSQLQKLQEQLDTLAAERDQIRVDRDALQADQIQWGLDREQLLAEQGKLRERASALEADLASERADYQTLQSQHGQMVEQSNKLAVDWAARRQALAAEIAAQNQEMEEVRKALVAAEERARRPAPVPVAAPIAASQPSTIVPLPVASGELSHTINSRLNALVGFSSVLLDERSNPVSAEERREYLKYLHESATKLSQMVRTLTGVRPSASESSLPAGDPERRPPDILVADNDHASRQRIEPFLKRAGYEVIYVENGPRAMEKAGHLQPLAILIDAQLPPSGGPALIRELRKDPRTREIPMVLLNTTEAVPPAIGQVDVLTKPIDRQELVQLMVRYDLMADSKRAKKMPANVLVIDDDPQALSLVKAMLRPFNVRVATVDSGKAGIEQALRNKPDLVILDLIMPEVDGFEVVSALRRDREMSRVPILVHTAKMLTAEDRQRLEGKVESIVEKAEFQPERFLELLLKRGERRKRAA